jgi:plasmid stabilization system protein ParE
MSRPLRVLGRAAADVDDIFNWLARRSVVGAISWYAAFHSELSQIASSPESFAEAAESRPLGWPLRQALFKTRRGRIYRVLFQLFETEIIVLRVRGPGQPPLRRRDFPAL